MLELPLLDGIPGQLHAGGESPVFERLARDLAINGFMAPPDLRVGGGGLRTLVEKPFRRWWAERGLPERLPYLPLQFTVRAGSDWGEVPAGGEDSAWLVLENHAAPQRCYLAPVAGPLAEASPEFAQHAIAVLYAGLDALCHAITPRELLAFARAYWWNGGEDKEPGTARMSRRMFDHRVAPIAQAPHAWPPIVYHFIRGRRSLVEAVQVVEERASAADLLRPNAEAITGRVPVVLGVVVRWKWGDPAFHLMDHHFHEVWEVVEGGAPWKLRIDRDTAARFHGAWRIPKGRAALDGLLARVERTVRLMAAVDRLIGELAVPVGRIPYWA